MRSSFGFILIAMLTACGFHGGSSEVPVEVAYPADAAIDSGGAGDAGEQAQDGGGGDGDGGSDVDAAVVDAAPEPDAAPPVIVPDVSIVTPGVDISPQAELIYCYYFRTSNTSELAIKKWTSHLSDGVRQLIVFFTLTDQQTPQTLTTSPCGMASSGVGPAWTYSAVDTDATAALPADDGTGRPVAQIIKAGQSGFILMHFRNSTDHVLHANVELSAFAYDAGVQVTPASSFVTYNSGIDLPAAPSPAQPTTGAVTGNCRVAPEAKFFAISTHTHKQSTHTFIRDGGTTVFDSRDWNHPGEMTWSTPPFFSFASGTLSYQCEYQNPNNFRIVSGDNVVTSEMCVTVGYYFPAPDPTGHFCLNSQIIR